MKKEVKLEVEDNLHLELLTLNHAEELFLLVNKNRSYLREFLPWLDSTKSIKDSKIFIEYSLKDYNKSLACSLQLVLVFHDKIIGMLSLASIDNKNKQAKIGYWLDEECMQKGLMSKSISKLLNYAFIEFNLNKVEIHCATKNLRSNNIALHLGFKKDGVLRENEFLYDHFVDHNVYSLLKSEFKTF